MNSIGFIRLLNQIHGQNLPDLDWIQSQGLLAIKIAQHYALRVDFLDESVCLELAKLFGHASSVPPENVRALLAKRVDQSWHESVREFDDTPVASASIGQVHRARHADGTPLAVKIIKEDYRERFLADLTRLRRLLRVVLVVYPKLRKVFDPLGVLAHIEDYTINELDLRNEIAGQQTLKKIAADYSGAYDLSALRFARLYPELSGPGILVGEFVEGSTFDRLLERGELPYEKLLQVFGIHGLFLFAPGVFHGDIHPGNIMLRPDGTICLIDTGAVSRVGKRIRRGLFNFFVALCTYDYPDCVRRMNEMAETGISGSRLHTFERRFNTLYRDFRGKTVSEASLTRQMMETIKLAVNCGMVFEKGMFSIIKSMMYLNGMVLRCRPEARLIEDMKPHILAFQAVMKAEE